MKVLYKAPEGAGSSWKYFEVLLRNNGVSGRFACGFWIDLHFAVIDSFLSIIE